MSGSLAAPGSAGASPPQVEIAVVEGEHVVAGGRAQVRWHVQLRGAWRSVASVPGADRELLSPSPGTVWEARIRLRVPVGTRLAREESRPRRETRDALAHLEGARRGPARRVTRVEYTAGRDGRLARAAPSR
ncbi:MAG: hypothetical protein IT376_13890 [Polyangiaceae bacterium]|nr:hypothetical protein [Polyangiaceae bacterium]